MINQKQAEFDRILSQLSLVKSIDCGTDRVQSSKRRAASYEGLVDRLIDIQTSINQDIDILVAKRKALIDEIQEMDNPLYVEVLYKRYIERKHYETVADEMGYSVQHIRNLMVRAVRMYNKTRRAS